MTVSRFIASRLATSKESEGSRSHISNTIAWISVGLSIAVMIVAICVVDGFKSTIRSKAEGFMGSVMLVVPGESPVNSLYPFTDSLSYIEEIKSVRGVAAVQPVAYTSALLKTDTDIDGLYLKGIDSLYDISFFRNCLVEGSLPDYSGRISSDVLISRSTASRMGYGVGDALTAYFIGNEVKVRKLNVCGIFEAGIDDIDSRFAVADIRQVRRINGWGANEVSTLEIHPSGKVDMDRLTREVEAIEFSSMDDSDPALFVTSAKKVYGNLFDWLSLLDLNVLMILLLMILVAGFNMISAVLIILFEKIQMIGLLKSLGMTTKEVGKVFLLRSWSIVGKGLIWGNLFGIALCLVQKYTHFIKLDRSSYFVDWVPVGIDIPKLVLLNVVASVLIMLLISISTVFISKVSPDKTLKVE